MPWYLGAKQLSQLGSGLELEKPLIKLWGIAEEPQVTFLGGLEQ